MIAKPVAVYLAISPVDLRGAFDQLAAVTRKVLSLDPASGALFVFLNRRRNRLKLCGVRKPQQKGKVERAIRYLRDRFFAGRTIRDIDRGNAELLTFLDEIANVRPHQRWPERRVIDVLAEEKTRLLALPDPLPHTHLALPLPVDKTRLRVLRRQQVLCPLDVRRQDAAALRR